MAKTEFPPFYVGQKVISKSNFTGIRKTWGFSYPKKGEIVTVLSIHKHPVHDFWLITIPVCECELCHKNFAPIEENFQSISLEKILEEETKLISVN